MDDLLERVLAISQAFESTGIPHSFGGAIALAYYAVARPTRDIDINVYLGVDESERALASLHALGVPEPSADQRAQVARDGQTRLFWDEVPLDLFFANLDFHRHCRERRRRLPLQGHRIDVLSAEDLIVCKLAFGRDKDARDIAGMLDATGAQLDVGYLLHWVGEILGSDSDPVRRLTQELAQRALLPGA
jgi:hypothetical protein